MTRLRGPLSLSVNEEAGMLVDGFWGELGWTLENNGAVNAMIKAMRCTPYKTYRIFEKPLELVQ